MKNIFRKLVMMVLVWSTCAAIAAPSLVRVSGDEDRLFFISDTRIRYEINSAERSVMLLDGILDDGAVLPVGVTSDSVDSNLIIRTTEDYKISISSSEKILYFRRVPKPKLGQSANQLDPTKDSRFPLIIPISFASPATIAAQLSQMYSNLKIVVDERQRSLLIVVNEQDRNLVKALVKFLDQERPQVSFEAEVIEINRSQSRQMGIQYDYLFNLGISESDIPTSTAANPFRFGRFGRNTAQGIKIGATIKLLEESGAGRVVARPRVVTIDGMEARINATQNQGVVLGNQDEKQTLQNVTTGITLRMLPKVAPDGSVEVQVSIAVSSPISQNGGQFDFASREANTTVRVANGEPIVIGGLFQSRNTNSQSKVPGLSDIPILGELFKYSSPSESETDLVIIITPRLLLNYFAEELSSDVSVQPASAKDATAPLSETQPANATPGVEEPKPDLAPATNGVEPDSKPNSEPEPTSETVPAP